MHVDPTSDFVDKTDQVIIFIRKLIRKDPGILVVTAQQVSEEIGVPETEVAVVLNLINHLGTFWNGASGDGKGGYTSVNIEREDVKMEYLRYKGIDHLIDRFYKNNEPKQEAERLRIYESYNPMPFASPRESIDFSFMADSRIAKIVNRDYAELQHLDPSQSIKSVLVLSGGIIEGLLFDALVAAKHWTFEVAGQRDLKDLIHPAIKLGIIQHDNITNVLRVFRNIIHPAREIKDNLHFDESHAKHARTAVDMIISEVRDWHSKRSTNT